MPKSAARRWPATWRSWRTRLWRSGCPRTIRNCAFGSASTPSCTGSIPAWRGRQPGASENSTRANAAPCSKAGSPPCSPAIATTRTRSTKCTTGRRLAARGHRSRFPAVARRQVDRHRSQGVRPDPRPPPVRAPRRRPPFPACSAAYSPTPVHAACGPRDGIDIWPLPDLPRRLAVRPPLENAAYSPMASLAPTNGMPCAGRSSRERRK